MLKNTQGRQIERSQPSRGRESSCFAGSTCDTTTSDHTSTCVLRRMSQVGMSMRNKAPNGRSRRAERPAEARKRAGRCSVRARPVSTHEDAPGESPEPPARSSRRPVLVGEVVLVRDGAPYTPINRRRSFQWRPQTLEPKPANIGYTAKRVLTREWFHYLCSADLPISRAPPLQGGAGASARADDPAQ